MKRFFQTIKNIFKIEELRKRLGYTFLLLLVYRLGSFIVVPGIDPTMLQNLEAQASTGLLSLLDMFSGGAFGNASIFALGVMRHPASGCDGPLFPEDAERRGERT